MIARAFGWAVVACGTSLSFANEKIPSDSNIVVAEPSNRLAEAATQTQEIAIARIAVKNGTLPFSDLSEVTSAVMTEAYRRTGVNARFVDMPAKRCLVAAQAGEVDADLHRIAGMARDYPDLVTVPVPIYRIEVRAYALDPHLVINGWNDLKSRRIAIQAGVQILERGTSGMSAEKPQTCEAAFTMLADRRVDVAVLQADGMARLLKEMGLASVIHRLTPPVEVQPLHHHVHRKQADLINRLTQSLREMEADGSMKAIHARVVAEQERRLAEQPARTD